MEPGCVWKTSKTSVEMEYPDSVMPMMTWEKFWPGGRGPLQVEEGQGNWEPMVTLHSPDCVSEVNVEYDLSSNGV